MEKPKLNHPICTLELQYIQISEYYLYIVIMYCADACLCNILT